MITHYWKVRLVHKNTEIPIDLHCKSRAEARKYKKLHKTLETFKDVKIYKVVPFVYPNPLVTQKGLQCEYLQEVR